MKETIPFLVAAAFSHKFCTIIILLYSKIYALLAVEKRIVLRVGAAWSWYVYYKAPRGAWRVMTADSSTVQPTVSNILLLKLSTRDNQSLSEASICKFGKKQILWKYNSIKYTFIYLCIIENTDSFCTQYNNFLLKTH